MNIALIAHQDAPWVERFLTMLENDFRVRGKDRDVVCYTKHNRWREYDYFVLCLPNGVDYDMIAAIEFESLLEVFGDHCLLVVEDDYAEPNNSNVCSFRVLQKKVFESGGTNFTSLENCRKALIAAKDEIVLDTKE